MAVTIPKPTVSRWMYRSTRTMLIAAPDIGEPACKVVLLSDDQSVMLSVADIFGASVECGRLLRDHPGEVPGRLVVRWDSAGQWGSGPGKVQLLGDPTELGVVLARIPNLYAALRGGDGRRGLREIYRHLIAEHGS